MNQKANSLPDTFAVFILTHGRPDNVITHKTLQKCGYTGNLLFIVDDEDKTVDRYIANFGRDRVIVFNKKEVADACDEGNNFGERRAILYARNVCFDIAKAMGINHFVQFDDDYIKFMFRFDKGLSRHWLIKRIDPIFSAFLDFYKSIPALSVAFSQGGDHIGGFSGITHLKRKVMNSFFCSTERPFRFVGAINEDVNTYTTLGSRGGIFFTFTSLQLDQKETQSQSGGMTENYVSSGTYVKSFHSVMMMPSSVKVAMMNSNNPRIHHAIDWKATVPCIIRDSTPGKRAVKDARLDSSLSEKHNVLRFPIQKIAEKPAAVLSDKWQGNWWESK